MPERLRTYFRLFSDQPPLFRALCLARGQPREPAMHWAKDWHCRGALTHSFGCILIKIERSCRPWRGVLRQEVQGVSMHPIPFSRTINNREIHPTFFSRFSFLGSRFS